jgi:MSHA pilin protein MshC
MQPMRGFTIIELIVVILIMAILAAFAAPRFFARGDVEGPGFAHELASAARYAQKLAIASGCPVRLVVTAADYQLLQPQAAPAAACDTAFTRAVLSPASGGPYVGTAPGGVAIGGSLGTVQFGASGAPGAAASFTVSGLTVSIAAGTGFVHVQ